jgi:hypothetical protein
MGERVTPVGLASWTVLSRASIRRPGLRFDAPLHSGVHEYTAYPFKPMSLKKGRLCRLSLRKLEVMFDNPKLSDIKLEVLQNSIKVGCNTRLKRVRVLPHKTDLNMDFELALNGLSV